MYLEDYEEFYGNFCAVELVNRATYRITALGGIPFNANLEYTGTLKSAIPHGYDIAKITTPNGEVVYNRTKSLVVELLWIGL